MFGRFKEAISGIFAIKEKNGVDRAAINVDWEAARTIVRAIVGKSIKSDEVLEYFRSCINVRRAFVSDDGEIRNATVAADEFINCLGHSQDGFDGEYHRDFRYHFEKTARELKLKVRLPWEGNHGLAVESAIRVVLQEEIERVVQNRNI